MMKPNIFPRAFFYACCVFAAALILPDGEIAAQTTSAGLPRAASEKVTADEDFELKIDQSRTVEQNYERSTSVQINNNNVSIGVGAAVRARRIDILLRGVQGHVRFRASLEALRRRLEQSRPQLLTSGNR